MTEALSDPSRDATAPRPTEAEYEAAGLLDRIRTSRADRLALLEWLEQRGFTVEQMAAAHAEHQLHSLATDRELLFGNPVTVEQLAELAEMPLEVLRKVLQAAGFAADAAPLTDGAVGLMREFSMARQLFSDEEALHFTRVMGSSLARIAEAANALFLLDLEGPLWANAPSELALAKASLEATSSLTNVANAIGSLFRMHMYDATMRSREARQVANDPDLVPLAIGFVDLVGFTPLTVSASARELLALLVEFEGRAYDLVTDHGGRVVKLIGDEVMFATIDPASACRIALRLFDELGERAEITPRAGIAYGDVLAHGGDYYGPVVNLASRIADIAVPWEILVTDDLAAILPAPLPSEPAGRRQLKGFEAPIALRALLRHEG